MIGSAEMKIVIVKTDLFFLKMKNDVAILRTLDALTEHQLVVTMGTATAILETIMVETITGITIRTIIIITIGIMTGITMVLIIKQMVPQLLHQQFSLPASSPPLFLSSSWPQSTW